MDIDVYGFVRMDYFFICKFTIFQFCELCVSCVYGGLLLTTLRLGLTILVKMLCVYLWRYLKP